MPPVTSDYLAIRQSRKRKLAKRSGIPLPFDATMGSLGGQVRLAGRQWTFRSGRAGNNLGGLDEHMPGFLPPYRGPPGPLDAFLAVWVHVFPPNRRVGDYFHKKLGDGVVITRTTQTRCGFAARAVLQVDGPSLVIGKPASQPARAHCMCYSQGQVDVVVVNHSPSYVLLQTISCYHPVP